MRDLNTIYWNRITLNTAYIVYDNSEQLRNTISILKKLHIGYTVYITTDNPKMYTLKMFRVKSKMLELCKEMKGVIG